MYGNPAAMDTRGWKFSRTKTDRATLAARQLLRDLSFARQRAVATGTRSWVVFDTGNHSWSVLAEDPTTPGRTNASVIEDPATGQDFIQPLDIKQFVELDLFYEELDSSMRDIRELPPAEGFDKVRLPGELEWERANEWRENGIPIHRDHARKLEELAAPLKIEVPWSN
ncbi:MAG: GspH/FimT family pseudopilin [Planctomycetes bacterium]|nr:GspH/FimT family pseudopilin [Planctomycetota bacterium]